MKLAIMQPYIFPYIGYFQLISAVDLFVFYNDVNFIKKGWINRNRILLNGNDFLFTIPCEDVSQNKLISNTKVIFDLKERNKLLATIQQAYKRAPFFNTVYDIVGNVLSTSYTYIDEMASASVKEICRYLNIGTELKKSHNYYNNSELVQTQRIIDICLKEQADQYINAAGGAGLYSKEQFEFSGIKLNFLESKPVFYKQFDNEFVPSLSIIDVLMFNSKDSMEQMLQSYELV